LPSGESFSPRLSRRWRSHMTPERYKRICEAFWAALALEPGLQREEFLKKLGDEPDPVASEVEGWLARDAEASQELPLEPPTPPILPPPVPPDPMIGRQVGTYKIVKRIGGGGMGDVYLAVRQDDIKLRVAVKLIKRGMDSKEILQRFYVERQILAR